MTDPKDQDDDLSLSLDLDALDEWERKFDEGAEATPDANEESVAEPVAEPVEDPVLNAVEAELLDDPDEPATAVFEALLPDEGDSSFALDLSDPFATSSWPTEELLAPEVPSLLDDLSEGRGPSLVAAPGAGLHELLDDLKPPRERDDATEPFSISRAAQATTDSARFGDDPFGILRIDASDDDDDDEDEGTATLFIAEPAAPPTKESDSWRPRAELPDELFSELEALGGDLAPSAIPPAIPPAAVPEEALVHLELPDEPSLTTEALADESFEEELRRPSFVTLPPPPGEEKPVGEEMPITSTFNKLGEDAQDTEAPQDTESQDTEVPESTEASDPARNETPDATDTEPAPAEPETAAEVVALEAEPELEVAVAPETEPTRALDEEAVAEADAEAERVSRRAAQAFQEEEEEDEVPTKIHKVSDLLAAGLFRGKRDEADRLLDDEDDEDEDMDVPTAVLSTSILSSLSDGSLRDEDDQDVDEEHPTTLLSKEMFAPIDILRNDEPEEPEESGVPDSDPPILDPFKTTAERRSSSPELDLNEFLDDLGYPEDVDDEPQLSAARAELADFTADWDELDDDAPQLDWEEGELSELSDEELDFADIAPPSATRLDDQGAATARRLIYAKKGRVERLGLVGDTTEVARARVELLQSLAKGASGAVRARLLVTAAELEEAAGRTDEARALYGEAHQADRLNVVAVRALRRDAVLASAWTVAAQLLQTEISLPISDADRRAALTLLAEVQLHACDDANAAELTARAALDLGPSPVAALLLAETCKKQGRTGDRLDALEQAANTFEDGRARASLLTTAAAGHEDNGDVERARALFQSAVEAGSEEWATWLGIARTARAAKDVNAVQRAIEKLEPAPAVREAMIRNVARTVHYGLGDAKRALLMLAGAKGPLAIRALADAARDDGDTETQLEAIESWVAAQTGEGRARALISLAELRAERGEMAEAYRALDDAAVLAPDLGTTRVLREVIARRSKDAKKLAEIVEGQSGRGALYAAAKLALNPTTQEHEQELLARARDEGASPLTTEALSLDVALAAGDAEFATRAMTRALERAQERSGTDQQLATHLAFSELKQQLGDHDGAIESLHEARQVVPNHPLVLRPLAHLLAETSPIEAASLGLEEAEGARDTRAAFAASNAGRILERAGEDAMAAYRRALELMPTYPPALWAMEPLARASDDRVALREVYETLGEIAADPVESGGRRVRSALLATDPKEAADQLGHAREAFPDDPMITELLIGAGEGVAPAHRAEILASAAASAKDPARVRAARLRAALAFEASGDLVRAREFFAEVGGEDPLSAAGLARTESAAPQDEVLSALEADSESLHGLRALGRARERAGQFAPAVEAFARALELAPTDIPTLREYERAAMLAKDNVALLDAIERAVVQVRDPADVAGLTQVAARLRLAAKDADGTAADELLTATASRAELDRWLARRVAGLARSTGNQPLRLRALLAATRGEGDDAVASTLVRAASSARDTDGPGAAVDILKNATVGDHPVFHEEFAKQLLAAGEDFEAAAEAFERAAAMSRVESRKIQFWYVAARTWQDRVGNADRAHAALMEVRRRDVGFRDTFKRIRQNLLDRGEYAELNALIDDRMKSDVKPTEQVSMLLTRAEVRERLGDKNEARESLRSALEIAPNQPDALRRLAQLALDEEDWRDAAELLIKVARLRQERSELRWVFFTLGDIYDTHLPDPRRAEAAFQRVVKLVPDDREAMERLAALYLREGRTQQAVAVRRRLAESAESPAEARAQQIAIASAMEAGGETRGAEDLLEALRRDAPRDLDTLKALADFYQRQGARAAFGMHINRALSEFRGVLDEDVTNAEAWRGLSTLLEWRDDTDPARVCAAAGAALGVTDEELAKRLNEHGGVPGGEHRATTVAVRERIAPTLVNAATVAVFQIAREVFDKLVPFDPSAWKADRAPRSHPLQRELHRVSQWFGAPEVQLFTTKASPRVCVPVSNAPIRIVVGQELASSTTAKEREFLFARAMAIACAHLSPAVRLDSARLAQFVVALVRIHNPSFAPSGVDLRRIDELTRRVSKALGRSARSELQHVAIEMGGAPGFDATRLGLAAAELGDRVALLATGNVGAGVRGLMKISGESTTDPAAYLTNLRRVPEAWGLYTFAISEAHFEARRQVGTSGR